MSGILTCGVCGHMMFVEGSQGILSCGGCGHMVCVEGNYGILTCGGCGHKMYVEGSEYEQAEIYESQLQVKKTGWKPSPLIGHIRNQFCQHTNFGPIFSDMVSCHGSPYKLIGTVTQQPFSRFFFLPNLFHQILT